MRKNIYKLYMWLGTDILNRRIQKKQKMNDPTQKWAKNLNSHFSQKDMQTANKHMKNAQHN